MTTQTRDIKEEIKEQRAFLDHLCKKKEAIDEAIRDVKVALYELEREAGKDDKGISKEN